SSPKRSRGSSAKQAPRRAPPRSAEDSPETASTSRRRGPDLLRTSLSEYRHRGLLLRGPQRRAIRSGGDLLYPLCIIAWVRSILDVDRLHCVPSSSRPTATAAQSIAGRSRPPLIALPALASP